MSKSSYRHDLILWHGTNQSFDTFDNGHLGLHTCNSASRGGFFLASNPETARAYAISAAEKLVPNQKNHEAAVRRILDEADRYLEMRDFDRFEDAIMRAEELEAAAVYAPPSGSVILKCRVSLNTPKEIDASVWRNVADLGGVIMDAKIDGYDALILRNIHDIPSGEGPLDDHVVVFDGHQIEILERFDVDVDLSAMREPIPQGTGAAVDPFTVAKAEESLALEA